MAPTPAHAGAGSRSAFVAVMVVLTPLGPAGPRWCVRRGRAGRPRPRPSYGLQRGARPGSNRYNGFWSHTLLGGYGFRQRRPSQRSVTSLSAVVGIAVVGLAVYHRSATLLRTGAARTRRRRASADGPRQRGRRVHDSAATVATDSPERRPGRARRPPGCCRARSRMCPCGCIGKRKKGSFVEQDPRRRRRPAAPGDVQRRRRPPAAGCCSGSTRGSSSWPARRCWSRPALPHNIAVLLALYALTLVLAAGLAGCRSASSSSGCGCSSRSSPASWCCRRRCRSSRPATSCCRCGTGTASRQGFTAQGLTSAGLVVSRVAVVDLAGRAAHPHHPVGPAAGRRCGSLGVPRMFILIIGMAYRYIFLLLATVDGHVRAPARPARWRQTRHDGGARRFVSACAGALIGKVAPACPRRCTRR